MKEIKIDKEVAHYIKTSNLYQIFNSDIDQHSQLFQYDKGELLCENGSRITHLLFLVEGEAKVYTTLDNGKIYLLRIEKPLSVYGDLEVLSYSTYSANVEALSVCKCIGIPINYIREYYLNHSDFLKYMIHSLASRLDKISHMSTSNLLLPLKNKFASYLIAHIDKGTDTIKIGTSFVDIAEQLGTTYRHLSRTMKDMVLDGLIEKEGKSMKILELNQLQKLAGRTYRY